MCGVKQRVPLFRIETGVNKLIEFRIELRENAIMIFQRGIIRIPQKFSNNGPHETVDEPVLPSRIAKGKML